MRKAISPCFMLVALLALVACGYAGEGVYLGNTAPTVAYEAAYNEVTYEEAAYREVTCEESSEEAPATGADALADAPDAHVPDAATSYAATPYEAMYCDCDLCQYAREGTGVTPANVRIRFVTNNYQRPEWDTVNEFFDIGQLEAYHRFIEPGNPFVETIFTTDSTVTDFQFLAIGYCFWHYEPCCFFAIEIFEVLFALDALSPEKPLLVDWAYMGCFTSSKGVSFVYDGVRRYFEIMHSNYNGHLFLAERNVMG